MKRVLDPLVLGRSVLLLCAVLFARPAAAQELPQSVTLQPGWNAVWLEVEPADRSPAAVFKDLPLISVWTWSERVSATDFIQNPDSTGWNRAQWLAHFPPDSPEAPLSNLHAILGQRAYLIRLGGSNSMALTVVGRPLLRKAEWTADRYNLRGFPIDPSSAPSFRQFFRSSPAHYRPVTDQLEPMFRLQPDGRWVAVAPGDLMRRGEAYWVFSRGRSEFTAPFEVELTSGDRMVFNTRQHRVQFTLSNRASLQKSVRVEQMGPHVSPLRLAGTFPAAQTAPTNVPLVGHVQSVASGAAQQLTVTMDHTQLSASPATDPGTGRHATVLRVHDGEGTQYHVGVSALATPLDTLTGLWMGTVNITNVAPALGSTNGPGVAGPVAAPFPLRVLLHVDTNGLVSLLREVTLVYRRPATPATNAPSAYQPERATELVTNPARLSSYSELDVQAGLVRGRRLTAPHFDFARPDGQFTLALSGALAPGSTASGTLTMPGDLPTHPFVHRYHPDHGTNRFSLSRDVTFTFTGTTVEDSGDGDLSMAGGFSETIRGLHRLPLQTSGSLLLRRISALGALNLENNP